MTLLKPPAKKKAGSFGAAGVLLAVPTILIVSPLMGFFAGQWADSKLGTDPWLMILGLTLGFGAAGRQIYLLIQKAQALDKEEDDQ
ncbi:MAG: AtpZ/AtpI family protein [candidate division Zixibacteria bacterium]|nr:AtpZ/AtpI family protein [candidate division Zixibacteria bacterium]